MANTAAQAAAGTFEGVADGHGVTWRGIRYARAERFGEPFPVEPAGVVDCAAPGPLAPQPATRLVPAHGAPQSDDCLVLNVHSPGPDGRRPVLVWIHGGAFQLGSGAAYDGAKLAARGDIVVVTINYRLGFLGFGDLSDLGVRRNLGLRDQLAALRWVRDNIAAFGGDPDRVTVAGESAGSLSISLLLIAAAARGLFARAILQSGALSLVHSADTAATLTGRWREALGGADLDTLRTLPLEQLLAAQHELEKSLDGTVPAAPVYDGDLLPASLDEARRAPTHPVPLLAGSNRDESRLFELPGLRGTLPRTRAQILATVRDQLGAEAALAVEGAYEAGRAGDRDLLTDATFALPTRHFAYAHVRAGQPAYVYRFDLGGLIGAAHGAELTYLWPMPGLSTLALRGGPLRGRRGALADRMQRHWIEFVRTGEPCGDWPRHSLERREVRLFGKRDRTVNDLDRRRRLAWGGHDIAAADRVS